MPKGGRGTEGIYTKRPLEILKTAISKLCLTGMFCLPSKIPRQILAAIQELYKHTVP